MLKYVSIFPEMNTSTFWAEDFIAIARSWENAASELGFEVSGLVQPYGVEVVCRKRLKNGVDLVFRVVKKQENVRTTAFTLKPIIYSGIVYVKANCPRKTRNPFLIRRQSFWSNLIAFIRGFRKRETRNTYLIAATNSTAFEHIHKSGVLDFDGLYSLELRGEQLTGRFIKIKTDENDITQLIASVNKLVSNIF